MATTVKDLRVGDYFTLVKLNDNTVYCRGEYLPKVKRFKAINYRNRYKDVALKGTDKVNKSDYDNK